MLRSTGIKSLLTLSLLGVMTTFAYVRSNAVDAVDWLDTELKPVDVTMHDFMEGMFQAPYRRLKPNMAAEPKDNATWKAVRSDALIMAEGSNLLLIRKPEKDVEAWNRMSIDSRDAGVELLKAAKKKDYAASKAAYEKMLTHCNACHQKFDMGKNQLTP